MLKTTIFSAIIGIVFFLVGQFTELGFLHPEKWSILLFFFSFSLLFHRLIEYGMAQNRENLVTFFLATVVLRFILSMIFIGVYLYLKTPMPYLFVSNFFVLYLFYTIFEISILYRNLRQNW
jgi:hypothetical protein